MIKLSKRERAARYGGYVDGVNYATRRLVAYMDKTDFDHELGHTDVKLYETPEALCQRSLHSLAECGIVEVTVTLRRVIQWPEERKLPKRKPVPRRAAGGVAVAKKMTKAQRVERAKRGAAARWGKS
jgi:hypothetical protein